MRSCTEKEVKSDCWWRTGRICCQTPTRRYSLQLVRLFGTLSRTLALVTVFLACMPGTADCQTPSGDGNRSIAKQKATGRLNVLFLMTDEQHYRSLSINGNPYITTPNMDRIGREGVRFDSATCVTPYCSPSRASIITGVYPYTHRILMNVSPGRNTQPALPQAAFPNTETILHNAGYFTAHRGKWHLGDPGDFDCYQTWSYAAKSGRDYRRMLDQQLPAAQFAGTKSPGMYQGRPVKMIPAIEEGYRRFKAIPNNRVSYIGIIGCSVIPPELLPETQITNQVLELLEQNVDKPFMITASWSPPHDLWVIPEPYYSMVDRSKIELLGNWDMPPWDRKGASRRLGEAVGPDGVREYMAIYYGMVKYIDDQVGRVLDKLDELGLADNTLVIFTTDHGDMVGAHGCVGKSIFGFYDDLVHIPLMMRLPHQIAAGGIVHQPVSQIDYMPTILDFAGFPIPAGIQGRSMRPLIEGRQVPWRDYAFCQRADAGRMLRSGEYKLVYRSRPRVVALYDLKKDPHEDHNLADDPVYADTVRKMHQKLVKIMVEGGDPAVDMFRPDPLATTAAPK